MLFPSRLPLPALSSPRECPILGLRVWQLFITGQAHRRPVHLEVE